MSKFALFFALIFAFSVSTVAQEASVDYEKSLKQFRKDYKKALLADETSPFTSKKEAKGILFFEPNQNMIMKSLFIRTSTEKPFEMETYSGETKPYIKYGELLFEVPGLGTKRISVYQSLKALKVNTFKNHLFIPFKDETNNESTYKGGRYIDLKVSDIKQGIVYLDFNKAYNPWCAYGEEYSCPVPPIENHLNFEVKAGEQFLQSGEVN